MTGLTAATGGPAARRWAPIAGGSAMLRLLRPIWRRFEAAARDPEAAQSALWAGIAREAEGSPMWGKTVEPVRRATAEGSAHHGVR